MFKVGDKVRSLIEVYTSRTKGKIYEIADVDSDLGVTQYWYESDTNGLVFTSAAETFELVKDVTTKEIDVWVSKRIMDGDDVTEDIRTYESGAFGEIKAKLIIEKPKEKKIKITQTKFEKALKEATENSHKGISPEFEVNLKRALGFKY